MFDKKRRSRLMYWTIELLLVATLIFVCAQIGFVFKPIGIFVSTLFAPVLIAGFLFYALNPLVNLLTKIHYKRFRIGRTLAVTIVFVLLIGLIGLSVSYLVPRVTYQVEQLVLKTPAYLKEVQVYLTDLAKDAKPPSWAENIDFSKYIKNIENSLNGILKGFMGSFTSGIGSMVGAITSITVTIITVPFVLFYMLKDGPKLLPTIKKMLPESRAEVIGDLLTKMSDTIAKYISGQVIECLFVGTFSAIGYGLVGIPYALLIGIFAGITNIIPYIGPYIGLIPAIFVAFSMSFKTVVLVIIVCIVVQQIDGNLVYPNVIGKSLNIHPLTIIMILLAAGNIAGLLGMILAIPLYAVTKVVIIYIYDIIQLEKENQQK
ncbi:AI-2E family transporter [Ligilactobacillus apodemi]|uniref:AI-2E family transporter n=1 Tax=Ligilactobacillus apodemi TaxID=307126 RepID=UPI00214BA16B|nr:AI-2E family transporter [Ligilactobacillus apodemi]MCR1902071.1 AI-2E family transporter [Ligilactobacillus apodemi]